MSAYTLNQESFSTYYKKSFASDLSRLNGKFTEDAFDSKVEEYFYVSSYLLRAALQKLLDLNKEQAPSQPIDLSGYGFDFQVALGIAKPYIKKHIEQKIEEKGKEYFRWLDFFELFEVVAKREDCSFENFEKYIGNKFLFDLKRQKNSFLPGTFDNKLEELFYVGTYLSFNALQNTISPSYCKYSDDIHLPDYNEEEYAVIQRTMKYSIPEMFSEYIRQLKKEWSLVEIRKEWDDEFHFYIYKDGVNDDLYYQIWQRFQDDVDLMHELGEMEFPVECDPSAGRYEGPYPSGYFQGILDAGSMDEFFWGISVLERDFYHIQISMPNVVEAAKVFCQVLKRENITEEIVASGNDIFNLCRYELEYSPTGSRLGVKKCYDNSESIELFVKQVNERYGTHYREESSMEPRFPLDDPKTMDFLTDGDLEAFFSMQRWHLEDYICENPPRTYADLKELYSIALKDNDISFAEPDSDIVKLQSVPTYELAYLKVHYGVETDTSEKVYDI